jgi:hypothetical protein
MALQRRGLHQWSAGGRQQREPVQGFSLPPWWPGQAVGGAPAVEILHGDAPQRPGSPAALWWQW